MPQRNAERPNQMHPATRRMRVPTASSEQPAPTRGRSTDRNRDSDGTGTFRAGQLEFATTQHHYDGDRLHNRPMTLRELRDRYHHNIGRKWYETATESETSSGEAVRNLDHRSRSAANRHADRLSATLKITPDAEIESTDHGFGLSGRCIGITLPTAGLGGRCLRRPTAVADLFFDGPLFQQIAERVWRP